MPSEWILYVDESGDATAHRVFCLGGVLLPAASESGPWRAHLEQGVDWVPWPFHRRALHQAVHYPLWLSTDPVRSRAGAGQALPLLQQEGQQAAAILSRARPGLWKRVCGSLSDNRLRDEPTDKAAVASLTQALLEQAPATHQALANLVVSATERAIETEFVRLLNGGQPADAPAAQSAGCCFTAGESVIGDALPSASAPRSRHTKLLAALLRRVVDALLHVGGEHEVRLRVQQAPSYTQFDRPLTEFDLRAAMAVACLDDARGAFASIPLQALTRSRTRRSAGMSWVELVSAPPVPFDRQAWAGDVLADFVVSGLIGRHGPRGGLFALLDQARSCFGLPAESGPPARQLPHPTAWGRAFDVLEIARDYNHRGLRAPAALVPQLQATPALSTWVRQQAMQWKDEVR